MRIIHTSDWHLGRLFHGVNLLEDQAYILENFVYLVKESKPEVILISGDVYDRSLPPAEAVSLLGEILTRICLEYKVPVIIIAGNHDNPERLSFAQEILSGQGVYIVGLFNDFFRPIIMEDQYGPVYFCPIPYCEPAFARNYLQDENIRDHDGAMAALTNKIVSNIPEGRRRVGLAHALVVGGEESESERPLTVVGGAGAVDVDLFKCFHYTALGHLHRPQGMESGTVRYAGSLLKYSFSEVDQPKSVTFIELDSIGQVTDLEEITLGCRRDMRIIDGNLAELLQGSRDGLNKEDYIKVILKDEGALLDPLGKLRTVYPNILDLERPILLAGPGKGKPAMDHRKMNDVDLFSSFFEQVGGQALSDEEKNELSSILDEFYHQERGL
ncbi:MAG: exonuclease SbcCD subunit D [Dehalobacterium sp.]